ncbi:MAG: beta-lactamase family protein [Bryobacteraceae bacterium]|nr:beta-lactamase family protein [Bryobacteraceae bacterium]
MPLSRRVFLATPLLALEPMAPAEKLLHDAVASGKLRAAVLRVEQGSSVYEKSFGAAQTSTPFLIASISKPMTAAALMTLVDSGKLKLDAPASEHLPGLDPRITLRHLLSHSSGLPDMLPNNVALRQRHAPLSDFAKEALTTPLLFAPGTKVSYQSMGILLAATMAERVSQLPFPQFLERRIFRPLGMKESVLGLRPGLKIADTAQCQVEYAEPKGVTNWDWNSEYWRNLGAPWGGVHSTAADISKFLDDFLQTRSKILTSPSTKAMITNQHQGNKPYGIGWAIYPQRFGHGGSTGTLCWANPTTRTKFVLLTTLPASVSQKSILDPVSEMMR